MQSIFMEGLKGELAEHLESSESGLVGSYNALAAERNITLSLVGTALGNLAFTLVGYHAQSVVKNTPFVFSSSIKLVIVGVLIGIVLWMARSIGAYGSWRFFSEFRNDTDIFSFFSVEGLSDFMYVLFVPVYLVAILFDMGGVAIGAAIFAKAWTMYMSYPAVLPKCSSLDRILCVLSSFGTLILVRGLIYVAVGI